MTRSLAIIGAGGLGRELLEYADDARQDGFGYVVEGFFDDRPDAISGHDGPPVLGAVAEAAESSVDAVVIALGDVLLRRTVARLLSGAGRRLVTVVHPTAYVARSAEVGNGAVFAPFSMAGAHSWVGPNTLVNVYGSIGHDSAVGAHTVVSPYTAITGDVSVGEGCFFGTHVTVAPGSTVGPFSKIAAGSVLLGAHPAGSLLTGSPAKGRVMFRPPEDAADD